MCFGFKRYNGSDRAFSEIIGFVGAFGRELHDDRTLYECNVVLVGGYQIVGICLRCLFYQFEQRFRHLLPVDYERAVENLVPAVFGVHLRETEYFAVGQAASEIVGQSRQILFFFRTESQSLGSVVGCYVVDAGYRGGFLFDVEYG